MLAISSAFNLPFERNSIAYYRLENSHIYFFTSVTRAPPDALFRISETLMLQKIVISYKESSLQSNLMKIVMHLTKVVKTLRGTNFS